jgi:hypothetical protein
MDQTSLFQLEWRIRKMRLFYTIELRLLVTVMTAILIFGMPTVSSAQISASSGNQGVNKNVTLNLNNANIRSALKLLFDTAGKNYTLESHVRGYVTVSLNNVPFGIALDGILRSSTMVPLTYRIENGVYNISRKKRSTSKNSNFVQNSNDNTTTTSKTKKISRVVKILVNYADAADIAYVFGGYPIPHRYPSMMMGGRGGYGNGFGGGGYGGMGGGMGGYGGGMGGYGGGYQRY